MNFKIIIKMIVINRGGIKRGLTRNPNYIDYQNYQLYGT